MCPWKVGLFLIVFLLGLYQMPVVDGKGITNIQPSDEESQNVVRRQVRSKNTKTETPTSLPSSFPTYSPSDVPSFSPTAEPSLQPTITRTSQPSQSPTQSPTETPTQSPTDSPTTSPTQSPTHAPTTSPTQSPTTSPTQAPTPSPTTEPQEVSVNFSGLTLKLFVGDNRRRRKLQIDSDVLNALLIHIRLFMDDALVDVLDEDGYDNMASLSITAKNSEMTQTDYMNQQTDTLLLQYGGIVSFSGDDVPSQHTLTESILDLFNVHTTKNDFINDLKNSPHDVLNKVFDVTAEKQINPSETTNSGPVISSISSGPQQTTPETKRSAAPQHVGMALIVVGVAFAAMSVFVHTRKKFRRTKDQDTVISSCDPEETCVDDDIKQEGLSTKQPLCGIPSDIAPNTEEMAAVSPLRGPTNTRREKPKQKRKKSRGVATSRAGLLNLSLDTIEEDCSTVSESSDNYTTTTKSETVGDTNDFGGLFLNVRQFSPMRLDHVASFCEIDTDDFLTEPLDSDISNQHHTIQNPSPKEDKRLYIV